MRKNNNSALVRFNTVNRALESIYHSSTENAFTGSTKDGRVEEANASLYDNGNYSEGLTGFAIGLMSEGTELASINQAISPEVPVKSSNRRFEYLSYNRADLLESDADDGRAVGAEFKEIRIGGQMIQDKLINRGLTLVVDEDSETSPNWEEVKTQRLIDRILRNRAIRNAALLNAAAVSVGRSWDTAAGRTPDADILADIASSRNDGGLAANRVLYSDDAWMKRVLSLAAQNSAGGFAGTGMTPEQLAAWLGVDQVNIVKNRTTAGAAFAPILSNSVISYNAFEGQQIDDASHIKTFVGDIDGGPFRVYKDRVSAKLWRLTVECYETTRITALAGIRKTMLA